MAFPLSTPSDFLQAVRTLSPAIAADAVARDGTAAFPAGPVAALAAAGAWLAPLPRRHGGLGIGTEAGSGPAASALLQALGAADLSVARLFEAHLNATKLTVLYGDSDQLATVAEDARAGLAYGLWVTDDPADPVRWSDGMLSGRKSICSGSGHLRRALVTASMPDGTVRMALAHVPAGRPATTGVGLAGLRSAASGPVGFAGVSLPAGRLLGKDGDYLRQPEFSAGAWRGSAAALGAMAELVRLATTQLRARDRAGNPHQQARMGEALIALETASLWVAKIAVLAEDGVAPPATVAAYANLARVAVEQAALRASELVVRSLGLAALARGGRVELVLRDLATYLRQPAPDETLTEAAAHFMAHPVPAPVPA